jgi:ribosome-binding factor A
MEKINEQVKRVLSSVIRKLNDPRIGGLSSVVRVDVSNDLSYAKVYVGFVGPRESGEEAVAALNNAAKLIRRDAAKSLDLRIVPEFKFIFDDSAEYAFHIEEVLREV